MAPKRLAVPVQAAMLPEQPVPADVGQALADRAQHADPLAGLVEMRLGRRLGLADGEQEDGRGEEAERVEEDRDGRRQDADERAADRWPGHGRRRAADLELRVAVHQPVALDERGQVRLVGDVEEDGQHADAEADDVELEHRQDAEHVGDRDRGQQDGPAEVGRR